MSEDIEREARELGWKPQEEFQGQPENWVDAETFLSRGKTVMPLLKKENKRLESQLGQQAQVIAQLNARLDEATKAIEDLKVIGLEATRAAAKQAREDLLIELQSARESGDVAAEAEITDKLVDLRTAEREAARDEKQKPAAKPTPPSQEEGSPEFKAWASKNTWFGRDAKKTYMAMEIAAELREDPANEHLVNEAFFERVEQIMDERINGASSASKVGSTRPTGASGGSGGGKRSYADLPPDAKAACDRQGKRLIGEGKAFKDAASWQKHYVNLYFAQE